MMTSKKPRKKTRPAISKAGLHAFNLQHMGEEPKDFIDDITDSQIVSIFNWYSYMCDKKDARQYMEDYLIAYNRKNDLDNIRKVSDNHFPNTLGWISRLFMNKVPVPEHLKNSFEEKLKNTIEKYSNITEYVEEEPQVFVKSAKLEKAHDIIAHLEKMIDNKEPCNEFLDTYRTSNVVMREVISYYTPILDEWKTAVSGKDKELTEAYSSYSIKDKKEKILLYSNIISGCENVINANPRKKRTTKPKSIEKILQFFTYKEKDEETGLISFSPSKIIGAKSVILFDSKYKTVRLLVASDTKGLQVHRSMIINFDEKKSMCKRIGRNTQKHIDLLLTGTEKFCTMYIEKLEKSAHLTGQTNKEIILFKHY